MGILHQTPPVTWKRCLGISLIACVVVFCSCIGVLYYIGTNMSTEELEALDARRTSNALPPSERDTVVPKATATLQATPEAKAPHDLTIDRTRDNDNGKALFGQNTMRGREEQPITVWE